MKWRNPNKPRRVAITPLRIPRKARVSKVVVKQKHALTGGPLDGHSVWLVTPTTLPIVVRGVSGHYASGQWHPSP